MLGFGVAVLGVLGSFWGIVWFIRAYVEAPRVNIPAPIALASSETRSVTLPPPAAKPAPVVKAEVTPKAAPAPVIPKVIEAPREALTAAQMPAPTLVAAAAPDASPSGAIADRWFTGNQFAPTPAAPPPPAVEAQPPVAAPAEAETTRSTPAEDEVAESSVPAIEGPVPMPRPRPIVTASVRRNVADATPMPRPRPDGPAPQSVWTGVPSEDERFSAQQQ